MLEFFESITYWYWLTLGAILMLIEILVPGVLFLWIGIAAILTGIALAIFPDLAWQIQIVGFAVLSLASLLLGRRFVASRQAPTDHPTLNQRGRHLIGNTYTLETATTGGEGRVQVGDSLWRVRVSPQGRDLEEGTRISVIDVDGTTLIVSATDAP